LYRHLVVVDPYAALTVYRAAASRGCPGLPIFIHCCDVDEGSIADRRHRLQAAQQARRAHRYERLCKQTFGREPRPVPTAEPYAEVSFIARKLDQSVGRVDRDVDIGMTLPETSEPRQKQARAECWGHGNA